MGYGKKRRTLIPRKLNFFYPAYETVFISLCTAEVYAGLKSLTWFIFVPVNCGSVHTAV